MENRFKYYLSWVSWPLLLGICIAISIYGAAQDQFLLYFNIAYVFLMVSLFFLERYMPHEKEWEKADGQTFASILHTLSSKGSVQALLVFGGVIGLAHFITPASEPGFGIWPRDWPMWAQVVLGLVVAEFGLFWAHWAGHRIEFFWNFHAIHHSVTKLWFVNTGRFHFIDSVVSIVLALVLILPLGAPMEIVQWLSAITAFIGMLTHCNVEMRFGPISWVFNTPELHRWHHSKDLSEGNKNYGENVMIWDHLFGTYFNENRRPPVDIGIKELMPPKFRHQILWPFIGNARKKQILPDHIPVEFE